MLALRFDLEPAAYSEELLKLLNTVQPFPYADVVDIVRQELGGMPDVVFRSFEPVPGNDGPCAVLLWSELLMAPNSRPAGLSAILRQVRACRATRRRVQLPKNLPGTRRRINA